MMHWVVASPYFDTKTDRWISDAVQSDRHSFTLLPRVGAERNWHQGGSNASVGEWKSRFRQAKQAFPDDGTGVVTVFPQLAAAAGAWKMIRRDDRPLVAWLFNTEGIGTLVRRTVARFSLGQVDRFVVHSTAEIDVYADLLRADPSQFEFVPLQYGGEVEVEGPPDQDEPYVFATGSGYRDYGTFFDAVEKLGYRTLVLASDRVLEGLTVPSNVEILDQISRPQIRRLVRHARVNVVPLNSGGTTAGLVTIVETFRHDRSLVITRRPGLEDYCLENETVLQAAMGDAGAMAEAIEEMWSDEATRHRLDAGAAAFGRANCTDAAAGQHLVRILDSVCAHHAIEIT